MARKYEQAAEASRGRPRPDHDGRFFPTSSYAARPALAEIQRKSNEKTRRSRRLQRLHPCGRGAR